jgi:uncharacterized membrane protein
LTLPQTGLPQTRRTTPRLGALVLAALAAVLIGAAPAQGAFHVCNKSNLAARVALGHFDGKHWTSQGWWTIAPKDCAELIPGPLDARYYYLYATDGASGTWDGNTNFCTAPDAKFSISGRGQCAARGFDKRGFFQVDTGQSPDWTQSLSN